MGTHFVVFTDLRALEYLRTQPTLSRRQARWKIILDDSDFEIKYLPGADNVAADALSRRPGDEEISAPLRRSSPAPSLGTIRSAAASHRAEQPQSVLINAKAFRDADVEYKAAANSSPERLKQLQYTLFDGLLYYNHRLVLPNDAALRTRILFELHDSIAAGHPGTPKTLAAVKKRFFWPKMDHDIAEYVKSCDICQRAKPSQQTKMGLLQPLPIPERAWQQVTMDLITALPTTARGHSAIVVFVCKLTKMVHYMACKTTITSKELATAFMHEVVRLHGLPESIVSDRDPRFTASFWRSLWQLFGTKLAMSTAYHPQTDGQTERANRTLEQSMRAYVSYHQTDWDTLLDALEMAHNSAKHASTGFAPFFLNYGHDTRLPIDTVLAPIVGHSDAAEFANDIASNLQSARRNIDVAQQNQKRYADMGRRHEEFAIGEQVLLSTDHLQFDNNKRTPKLAFKYVGPFPIESRHGANAYGLRLPASMNIHPVFNVDRLKKYHPGEAHFPLRPVMHSEPPSLHDADGSEVYHVESILAVKLRRGQRHYLIKWLGWDAAYSTWEPLSNLDNSRDLVAEFEAQHGHQV